MRIHLVRSIGVTVGIIAVLLIAPIVCAASGDMPTMTHDPGSNREGTATPQCVSTSVDPLSHHALIYAVGEQVAPNRLIPGETVCLSWSPADMTVAPAPTEESPAQVNIRDHAPPKKPIEYHCRNYLTSEEPPL